MKFRPCIDIHNGKVKQIVGGSLSDRENFAVDNFVSEYDGEYYGKLYKAFDLVGGHIILLNPAGSEFYEQDLFQAYKALSAFEGGLQIGGGINDQNAPEFLNRGAEKVIVTSFVFKNGDVNFDNLKRLVKAIGKDRLTIDLSCRRKNGKYYVVTDRWQKFTDIEVDEKCFELFSDYCSEFLIHAVDAEGKSHGIEEKLAAFMGDFCDIPSTYAGGISSFDDLEMLSKLGKNKIDFTIGSALDIFGGNISFVEAAAFCRQA